MSLEGPDDRYLSPYENLKRAMQNNVTLEKGLFGHRLEKG